MIEFESLCNTCQYENECDSYKKMQEAIKILESIPKDVEIDLTLMMCPGYKDYSEETLVKHFG